MTPFVSFKRALIENKHINGVFKRPPFTINNRLVSLRISYPCVWIANVGVKFSFPNIDGCRLNSAWYGLQTRWRHQMETFSVLLVLCAGNSPVTVGFPAQRPMTRSFDVFVDLRSNKRLSNQSWGWWFETRSRSLWRHCNECITCRKIWFCMKKRFRATKWKTYGQLSTCL